MPAIVLWGFPLHAYTITTELQELYLAQWRLGTVWGQRIASQWGKGLEGPHSVTYQRSGQIGHS
jgi:hypothetical protein